MSTLKEIVIGLRSGEVTNLARRLEADHDSKARRRKMIGSSGLAESTLVEWTSNESTKPRSRRIQGRETTLYKFQLPSPSWMAYSFGKEMDSLSFFNVDPSNRFTCHMKKLIVLSLLLNIAVLIPVCAGLIMDASWAQASYGAATPARGILLSVYLSILITSFLLLAFRDPRSVAALLSVQILYKITTPVTVGAFDNPVVISNLGIAVFHAITLLIIWRTMGNPFRK